MGRTLKSVSQKTCLPLSPMSFMGEILMRKIGRNSFVCCGLFIWGVK